MKRILIVEDDRDLGEGLRLGLRGADTDVALCHDLAGARAELIAADLVLLDINLPDGSRLALLEEIKETSGLPVILLTANDTEVAVVRGLERGADDYITKPFSLAVLRARVNARLRAERSFSVQPGGFSFDFDRMEFSANGKPVELSKTEQKLLRLLYGRTGAAPSPGRRCWSGSGAADPNTWTRTPSP